MSFKVVLDRSRLTISELATLYGVSRQTIHTWSKGGEPRASTYTARMAEVITRALLVSLERRLLPMAAMDKAVRAGRIAKMAATLQAMKPAPIK